MLSQSLGSPPKEKLSELEFEQSARMRMKVDCWKAEIDWPLARKTQFLGRMMAQNGTNMTADLSSGCEIPLLVG